MSCLQGATYKGALTLDLCWGIEGLPGTVQKMQKRLGSMPIMVKSSGCHLHGERVAAASCMHVCVCAPLMHTHIHHVPLVITCLRNCRDM